MKQNRQRRTINGFTIVELLVTIIVISILATIATMTYASLQNQAHDNDRESKAKAVASRLEKYYQINGEYPSVASIVGQPGSAVKTKLKLTDPSILVLPSSSSGTTNSFTQSDPKPYQFAYNGESVNENEANQCTNDVNGGCDQFHLEWQNEAGDNQEIPSAHSGRDTTSGGAVAVAPEAPNTPSITATLSSPNVVGAVSTVNCSAGATPEYKILSSTNTSGGDPVFPSWSSLPWGPGLTKSLSATQGTHYYFKAIAHCVNSSGASDDSDESNIADFYYAVTGTPAITATISGTATQVTVTPATCPAGATAKYQIWEKKDTPTAAGTMAVVGSRNFTTTNTYTGTAGASTAPTKNTYRAFTRCDNGGTAGIASTASADASVVSAPAAPTLSKSPSAGSGTADSVTWSWSMPANACPVGTSLMYHRVWTGNYTNHDTGVNTAETSISLTTSAQGYLYGLKVQASCGNSQPDKVLSGAYSSTSSYSRDINSLVWVYKGSVRVRRPDPSGHPYNIYGQAIVTASRNVDYNGGSNSNTPNQDYPSTGNCASGLTRKIQWQWSLSHIGEQYTGFFGYNDNSGAVDNGAWSPEYTWANGQTKTFPNGSNLSDYTTGERDLDNGDQYEIRFTTRCANADTGVNGDWKWSDNFGNLFVRNGSGNFNVQASNASELPWTQAWHSKKSDTHTGRNNTDSASGTCTGSSGTYCWSPMNGPNSSSTWGW